MRLKGTVRFFDHSRGYGFVSPEGGAPDIVVQGSVLRHSGITNLRVGDEVSFEVERDGRGSGKHATNVEML